MTKTRNLTPRMSGDIGQGQIITCAWGTVRHSLYRPTWVEIHRSAFQHNLCAIRSLLKKSTRLLAVVKANAYGHMAVPLAKIALTNGADALGVSSIEEGVALRDAGISGAVLILGSIYPLENLRTAAEYRLTPTVSSLNGLAELAQIKSRRGRPLPFHLKVDSGMGRIGISPATAPVMLEKILVRPEVAMAGLYTHLSAADTDAGYTRVQLRQFAAVVAQARRRGLKFLAHAANSAAVLKYPSSHFDMVRPGIALYGLAPFDGAEKKIHLDPVLQWKTRVVYLKRVPRGTCIGYCRSFTTKRASLIVTLPVGYADGYSRALSNRARVLIGGRRCPVVGRVSMDMITVDVTAVPGVAIGDEVVLIGVQGGERIRAEEMAAWAGTINYEITCGISYRVPRILLP